MTNTIITIAAITLLAAVPHTVSITAQATAEGGGIAVATGSSSAGESGTAVTVDLDGIPVAATVTWDGDNFTVTVEPVPEWDESSTNIMVLRVGAGTDKASDFTRITR